MANSVEIPQDIIDNVIVALGNDKRSLKQCALVSSSFLLPSRKQLFYSIRFGSNDKGYQRLHEVLVQNPVFRSFVRKIDDHYANGWLDSKPFSDKLLAILQLSFCRLEEFSLSCVRAMNWRGFSGELKDVLSTLIHSPTLKILYINNIKNAPITLFLGIVYLAKLHLSDVSLNYSDGEQPSSLTPKGVATTVSQTVIDQCLWSFHDSTHDHPTEARFLPFMSHLRVLEIYIDPSSASMSDFAILSFLMRCLCASLTSPATLERINLYITFEGYFFLNESEFYRDLRHDDVWGHLDSIVTHPNGSQLQRVNIDIRYDFRYDDDVLESERGNGILEAVLKALPLLHDKGILFVEVKES